MRVLLAVADQHLRTTLQTTLVKHHFVVDLATEGEAAWELLQAFIYDVVLLEPACSELDGLSLCRRLRSIGHPVLILLIVESADPVAGIQGLERGADAYLVKPVQEKALLAQIGALTRRGRHRASPFWVWGPLSLDPIAQQVTGHGQVLKFNRKEYQILELLLTHPRQMFSCSTIGDRLWTLDEALPTNATIKSHIRSIRRKLEQVGILDFIQTYYAQGYRLNSDYAPDPDPCTLVSPMSDNTRDNITANLWQELMSANAQLQQEIERRTQIERRLRRSEMLLRQAQQAAQIGYWEYELRTGETFWSEELYHIYGLDPNLAPLSPEEQPALIYPQDRHKFDQDVQTPARQKRNFESNFRIIRVDTQEIRYINARGGPIHDQSGQIIRLAGTAFDVTRWYQ